MQFKPLLLSAFAAGVLAVNYNVMVGGEGGKTVFEPATVNAEKDDTVTFICKSIQL